MSRAWPVPGIEPEGTLAANARRILAVKIAEFYSFAPVVPVPAAVEPLHDMRIAAKRLRYTLELFRVVFGKDGERQIERIKAIQEELGEIHDHDVRTALIEAELAALVAEQTRDVGSALAAAPADHAAITATALRPPADDPKRGLLALLGRQHAARRAHYDAFVALWNGYNAEGMRADLVGLSQTPD
ncbi:MAG: hypothetical protein AVDCRST_MAG73-4138 [uncultured Thermomicrobiales bacterium]|uniref:CHAD domain-containing protein n=1 Tax=uncultured Thermomicrobiales bacterium TaxID=1645740 RepID=A0A6J4V096_9BACT|nr:MAG: hypothetical protein AVDCRST_MAG73-4138 [uncultured Thermomicrobiales bacterium]